MKGGILQRYLLREAAGAWVAVTVVLLSIMLATRFARYLAVAASGKLPKELLLEVVRVVLESQQEAAVLAASAGADGVCLSIRVPALRLSAATMATRIRGSGQPRRTDCPQGRRG